MNVENVPRPPEGYQAKQIGEIELTKDQQERLDFARVLMEELWVEPVAEQSLIARLLPWVTLIMMLVLAIMIFLKK